MGPTDGSSLEESHMGLTDGRRTDRTQRRVPGTQHTWERRAQRKRRMMRLCRESMLLRQRTTIITKA